MLYRETFQCGVWFESSRTVFSMWRSLEPMCPTRTLKSELCSWDYWIVQKTSWITFADIQRLLLRRWLLATVQRQATMKICSACLKYAICHAFRPWFEEKKNELTDFTEFWWALSDRYKSGKYNIFNLISIHSIDFYSLLQSGAILDLYPMARSLPDFLFPIKKAGKEYHKREMKLFMKHFLNARKQLKSGNAKVRHWKPEMRCY